MTFNIVGNLFYHSGLEALVDQILRGGECFSNEGVNCCGILK